MFFIRVNIFPIDDIVEYKMFDDDYSNEILLF